MSAGVRRFVDRRPVAFTVLLAVALALFLLVRHVLFGPRVTLATAIWGEAALLALALALVALLRWWRRTGIVGRIRRDWALAVLAGALAYYLALSAPVLALYRLVPAGILLAVLVGAAEEILCRGVVLEALRRFGPLRAGAGSAVFFGVLHLNNLFLSPSPAVVAQAAYAILLGLLLAAARLRLQSIWPLVFLHAGVDFPALATGHLLPTSPPNAWLTLVPVALSAPWGAAGLALLLRDELRGR
jgi:membrane protease YdiL (CAAX protease family)